MRSKPKGAKYRNLIAYRERIFYDRVVCGRRYWRDLKTTDWDDAIVLRDRLEELDGIEKRRGDVPKFDVFAQRYLNEDTERLAATTLRDRRRYLGERGLLLPHFASKRLDEITPEMLRQWWGKEITGAGRSAGTGRHHINTLAAVYAFAQDLGFVSESPVVEFRRQLNRKGRTKRGRAEARRDRHIRPIERPSELARLVREAEAEGLVASVVVLLQLDAGLRLGEAMALRWGKVIWGQDEDDRTRGLWIDENLPSGGTGEPEEPKSGKPRKVASHVVCAALSANSISSGSETIPALSRPSGASSNGSTLTTSERASGGGSAHAPTWGIGR
jgi:integrase